MASMQYPLPIPWQQFVEPLPRRIGYACELVRRPCLRVGVVEMSVVMAAALSAPRSNPAKIDAFRLEGIRCRRGIVSKPVKRKLGKLENLLYRKDIIVSWPSLIKLSSTILQPIPTPAGEIPGAIPRPMRAR